MIDNENKLEKAAHANGGKLFPEYFSLECQRFARIAAENSEIYIVSYKKALDNAIRNEYSVGGETIHRGYYCPSPVLDIIVGGCNRGRLLKSPPSSKSNPTYRYGFNNQNQLITVNCIANRSDEIIFYQNNTTIGIVFSDDFEIQGISECVYQSEKIISYIYCLNNPSENSITEYTREDYNYSTDGLDTVDVFRFFNSDKAPILSREKYSFKHDEEGYLSSYHCFFKRENMKANEFVKEFASVKTNEFLQESYQVTIRRKI